MGNSGSESPYLEEVDQGQEEEDEEQEEDDEEQKVNDGEEHEESRQDDARGDDDHGAKEGTEDASGNGSGSTDTASSALASLADAAEDTGVSYTRDASTGDTKNTSAD
ncbi:unnamed protein product [Ectocarpus sp. CCAP 1310/34]|nr:unnamed protein product [Ectocarpus sp. CCAP 1310/34]